MLQNKTQSPKSQIAKVLKVNVLADMRFGEVLLMIVMRPYHRRLEAPEIENIQFHCDVSGLLEKSSHFLLGMVVFNIISNVEGLHTLESAVTL